MNPQAADALAAAALFAIDPAGLGGVALRAGPGADRDAWLAHLRALLPAQAPQRRLPLGVGDAALLGGLDFAATLQAGRPVLQQGLLAQAHGGVVTMAMAERTTPATAARIAAVMDTGEVALERDGIAQRLPAKVGFVALDEGIHDDERLPAALRERLALQLDAQALQGFASLGIAADRADAARAALAAVHADDAIVEALCAAAHALGVDSLRAPQQALRAARAAAALDGRGEVSAEDAALAARLVLSHRATRLPPGPPAEDLPQEQEEPSDPKQAAPDDPPPLSDNPDPADDEVLTAQELAERVVEAAQAAIPPGLLAILALGERARAASQAGGRSGALQKSRHRGRPVGARRGEPRGGARLHLLETLRAAAPWQRLRTHQASAGDTRRIHVRREDFHVRRFRQHAATTAIFVVDASGSSALHRLAEAKGAVESLLADCYVRRDRVAVIAFRGHQADLLLPPTRSLARAKRSLAGLPGGGGTPLAAALDAARGLADSVQRAGDTPVVVLLTDGRANIARDGAPGRARATEDALAAAGALRAIGASTLLLDTSPQPQATAQALAERMGAAYLPLPHADARIMSTAVRAATGRA